MPAKKSIMLTAAIAVPLFLVACSGDSGNNKTTPFWDTELFPTGDAPTDVQNLQAALALGGVIYLRAGDENGVSTPFNLGGEVLQIETSVELVGEVEGDQWTGDGMTRMKGGRLESHVPGTEITVRGLHFVDPVNGAVDFRAGHNITVAGNRITAQTMQGQGIHDVVILPLQTIAVNIAGGFYADPLGHDHSYADITGAVRIEDNYVNTEQAGVPLTWPAEMRPVLTPVERAYSYIPTAESIRSWVAWRKVAWHTRHLQVMSAAADVVIRGNRSIDSPGMGIMMINGHGTIEITGNEITLSQASDYYFGGGSAGIQFVDGPDENAVQVSEESVIISSNRITTRGIFQTGIVLYDQSFRAQEFRVFDNSVTLSPTAEENPLAYGYYGGNIDMEFTGNSVDGEGHGGVRLEFELAGHASDNDFGDLNSSVGDFVVRGEALPESVYQDVDLGSL